MWVLVGKFGFSRIVRTSFGSERLPRSRSGPELGVAYYQLTSDRWWTARSTPRAQPAKESNGQRERTSERRARRLSNAQDKADQNERTNENLQSGQWDEDGTPPRGLQHEAMSAVERARTRKLGQRVSHKLPYRDLPPSRRDQSAARWCARSRRREQRGNAN